MNARRRDQLCREASNAAVDWREYLGSTEIPEHLRYKPYKVDNPFPQVETRYRSPPKKVEAAKMYDTLYGVKREAIPPNPLFGHVVPRYLSPPKRELPTALPNEPRRLERTESVLPTPEYIQHKTSAAAQAFSHVLPKYADPSLYAHRDITPRDIVESKKRDNLQRVNKGNAPFIVAPQPRGRTFKEMEHSNHRLADWSAPSTSKRNQPSIIAEWVKNGIPIPTDRQTSPSKRPESPPRMGGKPFAGGGGAGGGSFDRRSNSPVRRAMQLENKKAMKLVSAMTEARSKSPPRVATLSKRPPSPPRQAPATYGQRTVSPRPKATSPTRVGASQQQQQRQLTPRSNVQQASQRSPARLAQPHPDASPRESHVARNAEGIRYIVRHHNEGDDHYQVRFLVPEAPPSPDRGALSPEPRSSAASKRPAIPVIFTDQPPALHKTEEK